MKSVSHTITAAILTLISAFMPLNAEAQTEYNRYGSPQNFSDVVLIYAGNDSRNSWDMAQLRPYVTHRYSDGREDWFFDAFLFLEFVRTAEVDGENTSFGFGNGMGGQRAASQKDWKWILDEYFSNSSSSGIQTQHSPTQHSPTQQTHTQNSPTKFAALDSLIGLKITQLGAPAFRHSVIVVCPAPKKEGNQWSSQIWGTIDGRPISLETEENRLAAVKWYIDQLVDRWNQAGYKNIDLEGIYWIEEDMISNAGIIADVNDYARSKGLHSYWIPYYRDGNEPFCQRWQSDFKFDMAYFQPNYAFYTHSGGVMPKTQLNYTAQGAKKYGAGLELEFETSGASNALHSVDAAAHERLNDYMDVYTQEGVIDQAGIAYYVGSRGLNDMYASTDPIDHQTMDRLAKIISDRQKAKFGTKDDPIANITNNGTSVSFKGRTPQGFVEYVFKNCMANDLFTLYSVSLDGQRVNSSEHSDNIGPFLLDGKGWTGGNHLREDGSKSAKTIKVNISVDGETFKEGIRQGKTMEVDVVNELYLPDGEVFAIENVKYLVAGNSVEVLASHDYKITAPVVVDRYYGMQSMFQDETQLLAPGSKQTNHWITPILGGADNAIRICKSEAPKFSVFIEKSPYAYQAAYMMPEDLGLRKKLSKNDYIYVGNSYEKSYHKLMGNTEISPGETTRWHGVYTWFKKPIKDTFSSGAIRPVFEYLAFIGGNPQVLRVNDKGDVSIVDLR